MEKVPPEVEEVRDGAVSVAADLMVAPWPMHLADLEKEMLTGISAWKHVVVK